MYPIATLYAVYSYIYITLRKRLLGNQGRTFPAISLKRNNTLCPCSYDFVGDSECRFIREYIKVPKINPLI